MKKICRIALVVAILSAVQPFAHASGGTIGAHENILTRSDKTTFSDVPSGAWYEDAVSWGVKEQITMGTSETTFSPNTTCTNAEILTMIWRACGSPIPDSQNPFADVSETSFYYHPATWAYENNMLTDGNFSPNKPCTRSMAVKYLWEKAGAPRPTESVAFSDVEQNTDYAQAVAWAVEQGITYGTSETEFSPSELCSRAQIITFLYRDVGSSSSIGSDALDIII